MQINRIVLFILTAAVVYSADPVVENVRFAQRTDGTLLVDIYYDVTDADGDSLEISVTASNDNGATWSLPCASLSGDIGYGIDTGNNKHIVWDFYADNPDVSGSNYKIRVKAEDYVVDIDGNRYKIVTIGNLEWMAENLRVTQYRNGDFLPNVIDRAEFNKLSTGAYCYYDNNNNYASIYGALYNWYVVNDSSNIAPFGWHVATDEEWKQLEMTLGMSRETADSVGRRGTDEGGKLKETGTTHWTSPNEGATNASGFTARPGGIRQPFVLHDFSVMGDKAFFWVASECCEQEQAWARDLYFNHSNIHRYGWQKVHGFSIRCVRDSKIMPNPPVLINPSDGANVEPSPTLMWNAVNNAISYSLQISTDINFTTLVYNQPRKTGTTYKITGLAGGTTHYWRVNATNTVGTSGWSEVRSFTTIEQGTLTDIDGNVYKTVKIGDQWWMAQDLRVTHYRNGDPIPNVTDNTEWTKLTSGALCYWENDINYKYTYGALYNLFTVSDNRKLAPEGWHVPTDAEWQTLVDYLGGDEVAGGKLKETGTDNWREPNVGATNESGFTARPGGYRIDINGEFNALWDYAYYWSATGDYYSAWIRVLINDNIDISKDRGDNQSGFSVRLVKD